ncbi:MAG: adenosylcobinamide-GDP ribazoletransferase [Clostridia bacterium]|nr:adenosylcobinamide-GDP ribazoletransferase [Clostridia bacterium]
MTFWETIVVAFSMFSALPMPRIDWNERNMRYALCAFPLVGLVIGLACWGWTALCGWLRFPALLRGAGLCLIPVALTGGIHLDGYADTCDALASHAEPEKKQQILKDPHLGAFAAMRLCGYFVASFALWSSLRTDAPLPVALGFCLSRALSALAVALFPLARNTGLAHTFATAADRSRVQKAMIALAVLLCAVLCVCGLTGAAMAAAALAVFFYYRRMARVQFGGLSGDLAGWFLQIAELAMLAALCLIQYLEVVA